MKSILSILLFVVVCQFVRCNSNGTTKNISYSVTSKSFKEPVNTAVFTTKFVIEDKNDITLVYHTEEDNSWQFFSDDKFDDYRKVIKVVGLGNIIKRDNTVLEIADLKPGYFAHRKSRNDNWIIEQIKEN